MSTGGLPQYLLKKIESLICDNEIYCIEYEDITGGVYVTQKNKIKALLGDKLITLGQQKIELVKILHKISPNVVHFEEFPETFVSPSIINLIYLQPGREYKIIETTHGSNFSPGAKVVFPDRFVFVSKYSVEQFESLGVPSSVFEYPIEYKKNKINREHSLAQLGLDPSKRHILNVGLFTPGKNQAEAMRYAKSLGADYQFHFVGNLAENFKDYWKPLLDTLPSNCKIWNEREDTEKFYSACDLFLFTSKLELSPLVLKEAISWNLPILMYNLPTYRGQYDNYKNKAYLSTNFEYNLDLIKEYSQWLTNY